MTLDEVRKRYPGAETFSFGDGPEMCAWLLQLVREGKKTATCGAARDFGPGKEAMPVVGRRDIALDWDGRPAVVIETVEVTRQRFCDVTEDFALAEGEGSYEEWRDEHIAYFGRNGGFDPEMELICERFRLVEDFG
ncbi:ASCH domain-containing protein [Aestuariibius sp. 2305UL40-4]|uniref:ASCH domain-containing protein n=1 Tax=Aestuariibius violaceus TaxID=3234132 RepID=UPI00345E35AB